MTDSQQHYLLIINGKSAGNPALREAVNDQRQAGMQITVRATWEGGDAADIAELSDQIHQVAFQRQVAIREED